jgi:hypothetical protein
MRTVSEVEVFDGYGVDRFAVTSLRLAVTPPIGRFAVPFCCCPSRRVEA